MAALQICVNSYLMLKSTRITSRSSRVNLDRKWCNLILETIGYGMSKPPKNDGSRNQCTLTRTNREPVF